MTNTTPMTARLEFRSKHAVIHLRGRFDFASHTTLFDCLEKAIAKPTINHIEIDLNEVSYIDSSGLGQLLVVQDKADKVKKSISLAYPKNRVKDVLAIARFNQRFTITPPLDG
jgi:anti-anti-sigma factor